MSDLSRRVASLSPEARALLEQRLQQKRASAARTPVIPRRSDRDHTPLSFAQQRLWFLETYNPGSTAYNISSLVRLTGQLDIHILERSLSVIVRRHESLRAAFSIQGDEYVQTIMPAWSVELPVIDLSALPPAERQAEAERRARSEAQQPFDLSAGRLLRGVLLRLHPEGTRTVHLLVLLMHHIASDGWSSGVLVRELGALYQAFLDGQPEPLAELPIQYADYAVWQRDALAPGTGGAFEQHLAYWKNQLADAAPVLELPTDRPRSAQPSGKAAKHTFRLPQALTAQIKLVSQRENVSLFMTLLAAFDVVLARHSNQSDISVGTAIANRHHAELEGLIGFFVNTLVLRADLSGNPSFREVLRRVRDVTLGAYAHQDMPFEKLVEALQPARDLLYTPFFQTMFVLQNAPMPPLELPGLTLEAEDLENETAKFDLTIVMEERADGLIGWVEYVTDLFDPSTIERLCGHLHTLLEYVVAHLDEPIATIPLLAPAEQQQIVVEWNQTRQTYALDACLPQVFEAQVRRTPEAIALICGDESITYDALNRRANRLARQLVARGTGPETLIGLFAERGVDFITAILAIFKAGGAFVPLDPRHPAQRIAQVLEQSGCTRVLVSQELEALLQEAAAELPADHGLDRLPLHSVIQLPAAEENLAPRCAPNNLAYIMFTSGSTGRPKGVMVEHLGMLNHIYAKMADVQLTPADRLAQTGPQTFDIVVWQCLASLLIGGEIVIYSDEITHSPAQLLTRLDQDRIAVLQVVPSMMRALIGEIDVRGPHQPDLAALRWLVPTGDALPTELCRQWFGRYPDIPVLNTYGSTECSDDQCHYPIPEITPGDAHLPIMPIGRPIANMQAYVLDSRLSPVPIGVVGELYIGGIGVGRGYLDDPARTAEVFVPDPFAAQTHNLPGARLYKTSDQARLLADGRIEFLGRNDHLIKLRGFRIEPGDIEAVLEQHPAVHDTVVVVRSDVSSEKQLVAYVVPDLHYAAAIDAEAGSDRASRQVESWESVFDEVYGAHVQSAHDASLNLRVWTSSYTGAPLPEAEIFEAVEDTVSRILALRPRRVLELGCGTGLILFRIAPHCEHYCGTELSQAALHRLEARLATEPELQAKVSLKHGAADELDQVAEQPFDLIIVNETVQYFPSGDYLRQVLDKAIAALAPGGAIFLGGLRSLPQLESFHTSVQLHQAPADLTVAALRQRIRRQLVQEKELVVDPALFAALAEQDDRISQVQIQLKGGWQQNEFTRFRYDAVLQVEGRGAQPSTPEWSDWRGWNVDRLRERLANEQPALLALSRVPNARLQPELAAQALLATVDPQTTVGALRESIAQTRDEGIDPQALWELGQQTGYTTLISWSDAAAPGCFDVIFARGTDTPTISNIRPSAAPGRQSHTNNPLFGKLDQQLPPVLQAFLRERLPAYMLPSTFVLLDALPLNANGKVDRKALPAPDGGSAHATRQYVAPRTAHEQTLAEIWIQILGIEQIGIDDSFFELGGHSLLATGVTARVRDRFQVELPLRMIFESPTLARLAARIEQLQAEQQQSADDLLLRMLEQVEALTDQEAQQRLKPPADSQE